MDPSSSGERIPERPIGLGGVGRGVNTDHPDVSAEQGQAEAIEVARGQSGAIDEAAQKQRLAPVPWWLPALGVLVALALIALVF